MKKVIVLFICIVCLFVIQGLVRSIWTLWEKRDVLVRKQEELNRIKKEYAALKKHEQKVNDPQFAEAEIRNKLFYVKPNEKVVLLPLGIATEKGKQKDEKKDTRPVYQQWISMLVKGTL